MNTLTKEEIQQTSKTILTQLGGDKFLVMTGAYDLSTDKAGSFICKLRIGNYNYMKITLNGSDLYDITFMRFLNRKYEVNILRTSELKDVYAEDLKEIVSKETGLDLSL